MTKWTKEALDAPHTQREIDMIPQAEPRCELLNELRQKLSDEVRKERNARANAQALTKRIYSLRKELGI